MKIIDPNKVDRSIIVDQACQVLTGGGLVVFPTETTYGIGVDATNQVAVDKLLTYKTRRAGKPLSIAVADQTMAEAYVELNDEGRNLYHKFLPGPITVISKAKSKLADGIASERGTVGVRIPDYPLIRQIIISFGKPITATSANASYKKRPYMIEDILANTSAKQQALIDLVIDAGQLSHNEPSTVIDTTLNQPTVLRQGDIKLSKTTRLITENETETQKLGEQLTSQYSHYLGEKALIFALVGELGAGKTEFSKGIGRALGIARPIISPTYTISREYRFKHGDQPNQFIHIDSWRLFSDQEFIDLGFKQMVDNLSIISIEWADKVVEVLKGLSDEAKIIWVKLEYGATPNQRVITYSDQVLR